MKRITDTVVAFKLVWFRVACYFIIPFCTTFLALTETWSGTTWNETQMFLKTRMFVSCFISGVTSLVAFIDSSFQKARDRADQLSALRAAEPGQPEKTSVAITETKTAETVKEIKT